ncbi:hypothetical protein [uncultured Enterococcus sp.]|uniref:hypothetical protein n=1 Tax=uncultured Enterococcus sp. TaxID=167972 RepID=UPI002AA84E69|nr:hypothetical protein [uncultured Enterococcus sp.]
MFRLFKPKEVSVYLRICEEMKQYHHIRPAFELTKSEEGQLRFAPGAADGMIIYHSFGNREDGICTELFSLIETYLTTGNKRSLKAVIDFIDASNSLAISAADILIQMVMENIDLINTHIEYYANLAYILLTETSSVETVKFGIILSEPLIGPYSEKFINPLKTIAYHDEFTYFCLISLKNKLEASSFNHLCIDYADSTDGWGKVHSISMLENPDKEQQEWIIKNGCSTSTLDMYLGHQCLEKGNVRQLLESTIPLDKELLDGITKIFLELLNSDGPLAGFEVVVNDLDLFSAYIKQLQPHALTADQMEVLSKLAVYIPKQHESSAEGQRLAKKIERLES